jgi:hypothetical protein
MNSILTLRLKFRKLFDIIWCVLLRCQILRRNFVEECCSKKHIKPAQARMIFIHSTIQSSITFWSVLSYTILTHVSTSPSYYQLGTLDPNCDPIRILFLSLHLEYNDPSDLWSPNSYSWGNWVVVYYQNLKSRRCFQYSLKIPRVNYSDFKNSLSNFCKP